SQFLPNSGLVGKTDEHKSKEESYGFYPLVEILMAGKCALEINLWLPAGDFPGLSPSET
ncbi:hypothetical protein AVEN_22543-1, partial [Araneus ventricosus]